MRVRFVAVECGCGARVVGRREQTVAQLRSELVDAGWFVNARRNFDLCPGCLDGHPSFRVVCCPGCAREFSVPSF